MSPRWSELSPRTVKSPRSPHRSSRSVRSPSSPRASPKKTKKQSWGDWAYKWRRTLGVTAGALIAATLYYKYGPLDLASLKQMASGYGVSVTQGDANTAEGLVTSNQKGVEMAIKSSQNKAQLPNDKNHPAYQIRHPKSLTVLGRPGMRFPIPGDYIRNGGTDEYPIYMQQNEPTPYYIVRRQKSDDYVFTRSKKDNKGIAHSMLNGLPLDHNTFLMSHEDGKSWYIEKSIKVHFH